MINEIEIINRTLAILSSHDDYKSRYAANIKILEERLVAAEHNFYRLGVIGITSSGKSTMINALLGERMLPMKAKPTSNQLVSCRHGKKREATVFFENGSTQTLTGAQLENIKGYTDESINPHNKKGVRQIDITSPRFPFDDRIVLIDSPGLDAFGLENHDKLTMSSLLPTVDVCVFMTTIKPTSDDRSRSVLNAMAQHEKPVIIIQNMIDAIKESADKKKSVNEVAQEHHRRLERIIQASNIQDKSSVQIVQYSATLALESRENNDLNSKKAKQSNHQFLVDTIKNTFEAIKPKIDSYRLRILKRQIDEIIEDAKKDSMGASAVVQPFKFENTLSQVNDSIDRCEKQITKHIQELEFAKQRFSNQDMISQHDLDEVTSKCENACENINDAKNKLTKVIKDLCKALNMSDRELFAFEPIKYRMTVLTLVTKSKTERVKEWVPGGRVTRWFGRVLGTDWGYKEKTIVTPDHEGSKRKGIEQFKTTLSLCKTDLEQFKNSYSRIVKDLDQRIELLRMEHYDRVQKSLTANRYREIADHLSQISSNIQYLEPSQTRFIKPASNNYKIEYQPIEVSPAVYGTYRLAQIAKQRIHRKVTEIVFQPQRRETVVWGQDKSCECHFIKQMFGLTVSEDDIHEGLNHWKFVNLTLCHKLTDIKVARNCNFAILVNTTQIGEKYGRAAIAKVVSRIPPGSQTFLVAENFQENINGRNIDETIVNMQVLGTELNIPNPTIVFVHDNPIFNLVAAEVQQTGITTQRDETDLNSDLRSKFGFLVGNNMDVIQIIIRKLKQYHKYQ